MEFHEPIKSHPFTITVKTAFRLSMSQSLSSWRRVYWVYPIAGIVSTIYGSTGADSRDSSFFIIFGICFILLIPLLVLFNWLHCRRDARIWEAERTVTLTSDHLRQVDSLGNDTSLSWQMFVRVKITPNFFQLFIDKNRFLIIPRNAFEPYQAVEFLDFLASKGLVK
jgi:hypothetical protein